MFAKLLYTIKMTYKYKIIIDKLQRVWYYIHKRTFVAIKGGFSVDSIRPIENPENTCFKCLKNFDKGVLHKIDIPALGYGSAFDNLSTKIHLCEDCIKNTNQEWWELEIVYCKDYVSDKIYEYKRYKYEDSILEYVDTLPIVGQELFWNRYCVNPYAYTIDPQDWIDWNLGLISEMKGIQHNN